MNAPTPPAGEASGRSLPGLLLGAARLEAGAFRDGVRGPNARRRAGAVVALAAAAEAVGASPGGSLVVLGAALATGVGWLLWALTARATLALLRSGGESGDILRALALAQAPRLLAVLGVVEVPDWALSVALAVWVFLAGVVALRVASGCGTVRAISAVGPGWALLVALRGAFAW